MYPHRYTFKLSPGIIRFSEGDMTIVLGAGADVAPSVAVGAVAQIRCA